MVGINSITSYRAELEGVHRCLKHVQYLGISPGELEQWFDNEQVVRAAAKSPYTPSGMVFGSSMRQWSP